MNNLSATDIVLIIGAIGLVLTNTITAWRTGTKLDSQKAKLEEIHVSTNGNLSELKVKIESLEKKSITDTETVRALQDIVKNLTTGSSVNIIATDKK
jgi:hypothetical protein